MFGKNTMARVGFLDVRIRRLSVWRFRYFKEKKERKKERKRKKERERERKERKKGY